MLGETSNDFSRTNGDYHQPRHQLQHGNSGIKLTFLASSSKVTTSEADDEEPATIVARTDKQISAEGVMSVNTAEDDFNKPYVLSSAIPLPNTNAEGKTRTSTQHQILQRYRLNDEVGLCITLLQAHGVGKRFSECFCQFQ